MKTGILFLALFALVGCAQPEQKSVVRVCDPQGCTDRPRSAVNYETADIGQEDDARIAALEDVAKRDPRRLTTWVCDTSAGMASGRIATRH